MRCSNCMSVLVEHGTSLKCPSCNLILDLDESFDTPPPLDDPYVKATFGSGSSDSSLPRFALYGLVGVLLLGVGVGIGWFGQSRISDRVSPEAPLSTVETSGEVFQSVNAESSDDQPIMQTDLPFLDLITTNDPGSNGLVMIGSRAARDPARSQGNARFALTFDPSGRIIAEKSLGSIAQGELVSAIGTPSRDMTFAIARRSTVSVISQTSDGQRLWSRDFPSSEEKGFDASLFQIGEGTVLLLPGESFNELSVLMIGGDSYIDWQRQLPSALGTSALAVKTPFDEVVIASEDSTGSGQRVLHLSSLSRSGQLVMSELVELRQDQNLLAMTVDENGVIHMLISGAVPRVLSMDALGRIAGDIALPISAAMNKSGKCAIQKIGSDLRISCLEENGLNSAIYDTVAESARSSMLSLGAASGDDQNFLSVTADHVVLSSPRNGQAGTSTRIIPTDVQPASDVIDIPPPSADAELVESTEPTLTTASTEPIAQPESLAVTEAEPEIVPAVDPAIEDPEPVSVDDTVLDAPDVEPDTSDTLSEATDTNDDTAALQVLAVDTAYVCRFVCSDPVVADIKFTLTNQQTFPLGTALNDVDAIAAAQAIDLCSNIQGVPAVDEPINCTPVQ